MLTPDNHELLFGSVKKLGWTPAAPVDGEEEEETEGAEATSAADAAIDAATLPVEPEQQEAPSEPAPAAAVELSPTAAIIPFAPPPGESEPQAAAEIADGPATIVDFFIRDVAGARITRLKNLEVYDFVMTVTSTVDVENVSCGFTIRGMRGIELFNGDMMQHKQPVLPKLAAGETATILASFRNVLAPGAYFITPFVGRADGIKHDERPNDLQIAVEENPGVYTSSVINLEMDFRFSRILAKVG